MDYDIPGELQYTSDNEWVRVAEDHVAIGVTDFAQQELGDIVYVELPELRWPLRWRVRAAWACCTKT